MYASPECVGERRRQLVCVQQPPRDQEETASWPCTPHGQPKPAGLDLHAEISHDGEVDTRLHGAVFTSSVRGVGEPGVLTRQGLSRSRPNGLTTCHDGPALAFVAAGTCKLVSWL